MNEIEIISQFWNAMRRQGIEVYSDDIVADGNLNRIHVEGDRKGARNAWYVLHSDKHPTGVFGCNRRFGNSVKFKWSLDSGLVPLSLAERNSYREAMRQKRRERDTEKLMRHEVARKQANEIWQSATEVVDHPYLKKKGIHSFGLRAGVWKKVSQETGEIYIVSTNALLVPIRDKKKQIHSLQAIFPDRKNELGRDKDFLSGGKRRGLFYSIGKPVIRGGREVILICEGYATGASLHECTGHAVIVALDASNLLEVAKVIRHRFADATIIMAADNDRWTMKPITNPGVVRAREAAAIVGGRIAIPEFNDLEANPTDFNDLHAREGSEAVLEQIESVLIHAEQAAVMSASGESAVPAVVDSFDPGAPIVLGLIGDLCGFWTKECKVELIRTCDLFKDSGILRLQSLSYWQDYCAVAGASNRSGKYDRTLVGDILLQEAKRVGMLNARNVPASVSPPSEVELQLNLALIHKQPSARVIAQILLGLPEWDGLVWTNLFAERTEVRVDPPCGGGAGVWTDRHDMLLKAWLSERYGADVSKSMIKEAIDLVAHADRRHPVRDYLNSLTWDNVPRLDTWLMAFAGCKDDLYTRQIGAKSLIGAVARIMKPGEKLDTMLVLEGGQGLKKSALICSLAPNDEWFTDALDGDLGSKEAAIGIAGKWLIEVPELATLGRTRVEVIKSFLTRSTDHFRAPYSVRAEDHPRQCAFFGTVNPEADGRYLRDTTGGRRFWPVQVSKADVEALRAGRDQLWAEAVARYNSKENWWLSDDVEQLARNEQASRQESNPWAGHVEQFIAFSPPDKFCAEWSRARAAPLKQVTTNEIYLAFMGRPITVKDQKDSKAISAALKAAGWAQRRGTGRYWTRE